MSRFVELPILGLPRSPSRDTAVNIDKIVSFFPVGIEGQHTRMIIDGQPTSIDCRLSYDAVKIMLGVSSSQKGMNFLTASVQVVSGKRVRRFSHYWEHEKRKVYLVLKCDEEYNFFTEWMDEPGDKSPIDANDIISSEWEVY